MLRRLGSTCVSGLLLLVTASLWAEQIRPVQQSGLQQSGVQQSGVQEPGRQEPETQAPYRLQVNAPLVLLDVSVEWRRTGKPVMGLQAKDFEVLEDGTPQRVGSVSQDTLPLSLLLLFDLTDTVHPVLQHLADGAAETLRHLRPGDEVGVMTFSSHAQLQQRFTRDRMAAREGLDAASAGYDEHEPTFLFEDLWEAAQVSADSRLPEARRVQVWITDGSANDQEQQRGMAKHASVHLHTEAEAAGALVRSGAVVSAIVERSTLKGSGRFGDVERLAAATGGPVVYASAADAPAQLDALLETLRARYTLAYRPARERSAGTICRLLVRLSAAFQAEHPEIKARDVTLRAPERYVRTPEQVQEPAGRTASER